MKGNKMWNVDLGIKNDKLHIWVQANVISTLHSVTRCRNNFLLFGHLLRWKYVQWPHKIPKVGSKIGQMLNKPSKNYQIL